MLGTPGNPIITQEWQLIVVLAIGIGVVALIHQFIRRKVARDKVRDRDEEGA